jgi:hypothetical protein
MQVKIYLRCVVVPFRIISLEFVYLPDLKNLMTIYLVDDMPDGNG